MSQLNDATCTDDHVIPVNKYNTHVYYNPTGLYILSSLYLQVNIGGEDYGFRLWI